MAEAQRPTDARSYREQTIVSRPIFFSSTFRDMHSERDLLRNDAFLELNERLRRRHHELNVIDLRQGVEVTDIADEAARELAVLKVCLQEIERTRPFLIGLIGDRYGWIPPPERMMAAAQAAGFSTEAVAGKSVTELELIYAFVADPEQRQRSHIYIREFDYTCMPNDVRVIYDERFALGDGEATAAERWQKLEALKRRLKRDFPDRVHTYSARWDAERNRVAGLEDLGRMVRKHLWRDLDSHTVQYERSAPKTWQEADVGDLEDFVLERVRHYVERPSVTAPALDFAADPLRRYQMARDPASIWGLCLIGEPGCGKSALFARLYRELKARQGHGEMLLLAHASGAHPGSDSVNRMLRRWTSELAAFLEIDDPLKMDECVPASDLPSATRTPREIDEIFASFLRQAAARTRVVLLIDAIDQFERTTRARYLTWLPKPWPENARLLATAIPDAETDSLVRDGRQVELRAVPEIEPDEARAIAERVFQERYHRSPNPRMLEILLSKSLSGTGHPAHGSPLWLELALQEINLLEADDYERADHELAHLPPSERIEELLCLVAHELPATVREIYGELLERAERTFGKEFTQAVMSLIALGRFGWRESDLQALVPAITGAAWDDLAFAGVRRSLGQHLVQRGESALWTCFHAQLRDSILERSLSDPDKRRDLHRRLADHLHALPEGDSLRNSETMFHLIEHGDRGRAAAYLASCTAASTQEPPRANGLAGAVFALAHRLEEETDLVARDQLASWVIELLDVPEAAPDQSRLVAYALAFTLNGALSFAGLLEAPRGRILEACRDMFQRLYETSDVDFELDLSHTLTELGDFWVRRGELGDSDRALAAYQKCHDVLRRYHDHTSSWSDLLSELRQVRSGIIELGNDAQGELALSDVLGRLGDFYLRRGARGDEGRALKVYRKSMRIAQSLFARDPSDYLAASVSDAHSRLGKLYSRRGKPGDAERARDAYQQSYEILKRLHDQASDDLRIAGELSIALNNLGDFYVRRAEHGDSARALDAYEKCRDSLQRVYDENPEDASAARDLSAVLNNLGDSYLQRAQQGDADRALDVLQKSMEIDQRLHAQNPNDARAARDLSITYERLGDLYLVRGEAGDGGRAVDLFKASLVIAQRLHDQNPKEVGGARDLAASFGKFGGACLQRGAQGDPNRAVDAYRQSVQISRRLYDEDPDDVEVARDLAVYCGFLAEAYQYRRERGDDSHAVEFYDACLAVLQRLYGQNPNDARAARDLVVFHVKVASLFQAQGKDAAGQSHLHACHELLRRMVDSGLELDPPMRRLLEVLDASENSS